MKETCVHYQVQCDHLVCPIQAEREYRDQKNARSLEIFDREHRFSLHTPSVQADRNALIESFRTAAPVVRRRNPDRYMRGGR